jgi:uncharacterized coiled-coil protein SlyX
VFSKIIELSAAQVSNRRNIKWAVCQLEIENGNGCIFTETNTLNNIESAKNMLIYATFADDDKSQYTDHGEEKQKDGTYSFPNTSIVGAATDAYICDLEVNGENGKYLVCEGFIQEDKVPNFVSELEYELNSDNPPRTSVEICAKNGNKAIEYEAGKWTRNNRKPTIFDFNGSAFVLNPADKNAILLELNALNKEEGEKVNKTIKIELNELNYDDISTLLIRAFNKAMGITTDYYYDNGYWIHKLYPTRAIFRDYKNVKYYQATYSINNTELTFGEVTEVTEDWTPVGEQQIEVNASYLQDVFNNINKKGGSKMDEKDKKIDELNTSVGELNAKLTDANKKIEELNSAITEANKNIEANKAEMEKNVEELNSLRKFKEEKDLEVKKAEVVAYFENEVKKNGFAETELNSLKIDYVDKMDLEGLKVKEAELCVKKIKELNAVKSVEELNSKNDDIFMTIHNTEKAEEDYSDIF